MTSPCMMAATTAASPADTRERAISSANSRFSSRAQLQRGDPVSVSSSSVPPCRRGADDGPAQVAVRRQTPP